MLFFYFTLLLFYFILLYYYFTLLLFYCIWLALVFAYDYDYLVSQHMFACNPPRAGQLGGGMLCMCLIWFSLIYAVTERIWQFCYLMIEVIAWHLNVFLTMMCALNNCLYISLLWCMILWLVLRCQGCCVQHISNIGSVFDVTTQSQLFWSWAVVWIVITAFSCRD